MDKAIHQKIVNNEYVDFARLLAKDKILRSDNEDTRMEIINRRGASFFVPFQESNMTVSNFGKWEQVYRIFSNIYTKAYPWKSTELIQYNHVIFNASQNFVWDNVYTYDKEFRMHISNFPQRSWSVILQQAWSICLKDRLSANKYEGAGSHQNPKQKNKIHEPCRRYNKGLCRNGASCKYEHRCTVPDCGKFGHGAHICQLRLQGSGANAGASNTSVNHN